MERWLPVVGFEGAYEVSDLGRVRTVQRLVRSARSRSGLRTVASKLRSVNGLLNGYPAVNLSRDGKTKMRPVHTMVLEAFVGPRPSEVHEGCHGDGDPKNNALGNLRWGTKRENKADAFMHGTALHGEKCGQAKLTVAVVMAIKASTLGAALLATQYGVCKQTIRRARNGRNWSSAVAEAQGGFGRG